jgi:hypothetical protein
MHKESPKAAKELEMAIEDGEVGGESWDGDEFMGATDCPEGCVVEPDGYCPHGWKSAGLTLGVI